MSRVLLYHWSPIERRAQIKRYGLRPNSPSRDGAWNPPFVCFSDSPSLAWGLSGGMQGQELEIWDLWMCDSDRLQGYEELPFDGEPDRIKEYRVYHRVYARDLWYVATRAVSEAATISTRRRPMH